MTVYSLIAARSASALRAIISSSRLEFFAILRVIVYQRCWLIQNVCRMHLRQLVANRRSEPCASIPLFTGGSIGAVAILMCEQLEGEVPEPFVAGITVIAFMPELGDLDTRQRDRRLESDEIERPGKTPRQIGRQCRDTVCLRRDNGAGNKARNPKHDVAGRDRRRQYPVRGSVRGVSGFRCRHQNVAFGKKVGT